MSQFAELRAFNESCDLELMNDFRADYRAWLEGALVAGVPDNVEAFVFNLFEHSFGGARYGIEFIGVSKFDPGDPDWACEEAWEPKDGRSFLIPLSFCNGSWETCLTKMSDLISSFTSEPSLLSERLNSARGIGIGFVDGELVLLKA